MRCSPSEGILAALVTAVVVYVAGSLVTAPEPEEKVRSFFERLETPSQYDLANAGDGKQGERMKETALAGQQLLLVHLFRPSRRVAGVGFLRAYRVDIEGFGIGWALAVGLVGAAWLLLRAS